MAHNRDYKPEDIMYPNQAIIESELVNEMQKSYIDYAMSVIVGRALPDVRDGLKPVHRRILYTLYEDGLTADKPFKKSATCVGDVLGKYHPHGDASVYDALVRLAQDFSMRYMLIDGHGNFGSVDGDPPAAYRYTEARMSKLSNELLRDIDKETVDWDPNFDESRKEPRVLPSRFPNLLVNGSSGIAVGMATSIPPHNLTEVINACLCVLDNPDATTEQLMEHVKGPDFPTRGIIMGRSGIRRAYETGRGSVTVRARVAFEEYGKDNRERIIVNELPYQVNKRQLIKNIADQVKDKRLEGISDLRDESDRNGMRIVIELKRDANAQVVLNKLYKQTEMQSNFSIIMLALVNNQSQPKVLTLKQILDEYLAFQEDVITRRTQYDLKKAKERDHLLQGLLIAQDNIDEVIHIIRTSYDDAKVRLMERFALDEVQAQAILDMRLKALQGLDREKLENEHQELLQKIAYYESLLADKSLLIGVLKDELAALRDKYGDERRTEISADLSNIEDEDLIEREDCVITRTHYGYIKRTPVDTYRAQRRGGRGITGLTTREEDYIEELFVANTHSYILFFTDKGKMYKLKGYQIPEGGRTAKGTNLANLLSIEQGEKVSAVVFIDSFNMPDAYITMATKKGTIKRTALEEYDTRRTGGLIAILLDDDDAVVSARITDGKQRIMLATKNGKAIRFEEDDVRPMGRPAHGVRGMLLGEGDEVLTMEVADEQAKLVVLTENGYGKRCEISEFKVQSRGGKGIFSHELTDKTGLVAGVRIAREEDDIIAIADNGVIIRMAAAALPIYGRISQGVRVMRLDSDTKLVTFATSPKDEEEEEE